jgi:hypothetical protein
MQRRPDFRCLVCISPFLYRPAPVVTFPFPAACLALCAGFRLRKAESFSIQVAVCFARRSRFGALLL